SQKLLDSTSSDTEPLASEQLPTTSESMSAALQHSEPDRSPPSQEVEVPQQQDSLCIIEMMFLLRKLADKGHTIILVTHATNNINACDYVCFLAQGGRLVYFGPPSETRAYFGKADFAEIYALLEPSHENPQAPEEAETRFKASLDYQQYVSELINEVPVGNGKVPRQTRKTKQPKRGNPWKQFVLLSLRYIEL